MSAVVQGVAGAIGGGLVGFCVSVVVNIALLEISVNGFFATLFGSALLFMGSLILYRVNALSWHNGMEDKAPKKSLSTYFVMLFACLVVLAGLFCFILEKNWFHFLSAPAKIPMYTLLGVALWFALTFSIMDLFNFLGQFIVAKLSKGKRLWQPIVSTPTQICVVLVVAMALGMFFGIVFGTLDVQDDDKQSSRDYKYTLPVGAAACAIVGAINQAYLRPQHSFNGQEEYVPRSKAAYDDGI